MIRTELDLRPIMPFTRATAARLAAAAGRFDCRLTLECEGLVLNMKSMLGLLSQAKLPEGKATLVADGADEAAATRAVLEAVTAQRTV
jgi:phosphotransferase system HPr (HPr) family protein